MRTEQTLDYQKSLEKAEEVNRKKIPEEYVSLKSKFSSSPKEGLFEIAKFLVEKYNFQTISGKKNDELFVYNNGIYIEEGKKAIREKTLEILEESSSVHFVNEITEKVKSKTFINREEFEVKNKNLICLKNGILNTKTKELTEYDPKFYFQTKIPVSFNTTAECPKIQEFLNSIFYEEDIDTIQEIIGYILLRDYRFKKAMILLGERDSGKSTFLNLVCKFIGKESISGESLQKIANDRFSTSKLYKKYLNLFDDLDFRDITNTGAFKMLTGSSLITGEYKFQDRFQFHNFAKLIFSANKIPKTKNDIDDDAYYSRWLIIRCDNDFSESSSERDPNILEKIATEEELSGLLNWALEGLKRLLENGKFSYSRTIEETREIMLKSGSSIASFVQDELIQKDDGCILRGELYSAYTKYTAKRGFSRATKEKLGRELPKFAGYIEDGYKGKRRAWRNVGFKNKEEKEDKQVEIPLIK